MPWYKGREIAWLLEMQNLDSDSNILEMFSVANRKPQFFISHLTLEQSLSTIPSLHYLGFPVMHPNPRVLGPHLAHYTVNFLFHSSKVGDLKIVLQIFSNDSQLCIMYSWENRICTSEIHVQYMSLICTDSVFFFKRNNNLVCYKHIHIFESAPSY